MATETGISWLKRYKAGGPTSQLANDALEVIYCMGYQLDGLEHTVAEQAKLIDRMGERMRDMQAVFTKIASRGEYVKRVLTAAGVFEPLPGGDEKDAT